jgi:transketolase
MLPGLHVIAPADHRQCRSALLSVHDLPGPAYFRLGKDEAYEVPGLDGRYEPGRAHVVREGKDALFLAMGPMAAQCMKAADLLSAKGIESTVVVVASVSPAPVEDLVGVLSRFRSAITVESHYTVGGLGSLVCETAAGRNLDCKVLRCGVDGNPAGLQGGQDYLNRLHGLSADQLAETAVRLLSESASGRRSAGTGTNGQDWGSVPDPSVATGRSKQASVSDGSRPHSDRG